MTKLRLSAGPSAAVAPAPPLCERAYVPLDLLQLLLGLQLVLRQPPPRLEPVGLLARLALAPVDAAGRQLDPALDAAAGGLARGRHRQLQRALLVDLVVLREAAVATAVENIVPRRPVLTRKHLLRRVCAGGDESVSAAGRRKRRKGGKYAPATCRLEQTARTHTPPRTRAPATPAAAAACRLSGSRTPASARGHGARGSDR